MNPQRVLRFALRVVATGMLALYILWNLYWLAQARVPPSLFLGLTGLPAPTTGGTRSILRFLDGDWRGSLAFNAMTLPILALFVYSVGLLLLRFVRHRRLRLPGWTTWAWLIVLTTAWVLKLTGSPEYW